MFMCKNLEVFKNLHPSLHFKLPRHSCLATGNWVNWQQLSNMELAGNAGATSEKEAFECILDVFTEMCIPDQMNGS